MWCDVTWCDVTWRDVTWSDVTWCDVTWRDVTWRDVMWCDVMWCDVMWCDVMWCGVMWCDVMWCDVMWCDVMCYDVLCYDVLWCVVTWCDVMWWYRVLLDIYMRLLVSPACRISLLHGHGLFKILQCVCTEGLGFQQICCNDLNCAYEGGSRSRLQAVAWHLATCTAYRMWLERAHQGGREGRGMWQVWGRLEVLSGFWWGNLKKYTIGSTRLKWTYSIKMNLEERGINVIWIYVT